MTIVLRKHNGDLVVPVGLYGTNEQGDGVQTVGPSHPEYLAWKRALDNGMCDVVDVATESAKHARREKQHKLQVEELLRKYACYHVP